ncbi:hypothetical protein CXF85_19890 [Colwellia sp. 75C3]|nr:hypothetical protein CXF85_19890 [Colwellia sp. 75C3]
MMFNLVVFNLAWFGLVYWGNTFIPFSLLLLSAHLYFIAKVPSELWLILSITVIGIFIDSLFQYSTVFIFANSNHIPFWLMVLWACFGATICHSLQFLAKSKVLQLLVGALFAPLSYMAGYKFEVVDFSLSPLITYLILSFIWAWLFVLFFALKDKLVNVEVSHV